MKASSFFILMALVASTTVTLSAQPPGDDPFGAMPAADAFAPGDAAADPFGFGDPQAQDAADVGLELPDLEADPLVLELRRFAQAGGDRLAIAIREATRLMLWGEVNSFMKNLQAQELPADRLAAMAKIIGTPLLLRMKTSPMADENSKQQADRLRAASTATSQDVARIRAAISQLADAGIDKRLVAFRTLLAGGNASVAELVGAAAAEQPVVARAELVAVLQRFSGDAEAALVELSLHGQESLRGGALETLAQVAPQSSLDSLLAAYYAGDATATERAVAERALRARFSSLPTFSETEQYFLRKLAVLKRQAARLPADTTTEKIWQVSQDRQSVAPEEVSRRLAALRFAADAGERLRRLSGLAPRTLQTALIADLDYRVQTDPMFGIDLDHDEYKSAWGAELFSPPIVNLLLQQVIQQRNDAATVGLLRLLSPTPSMVISHSGQPTTLVAAASHPNARIRYEAVLAIGRAAVDQPYADSSVVLRRLIEMSRLHQLPTALLVEPRLGAAAVWERELLRYGMQVEIVATAIEAEKRVEQGEDLQLIIATTSLPDLPPIEFVDRIRRRSLGSEIPIVFVGPAQPGTENNDLRSPVRRLEQPEISVEHLRNEVLLSSFRALEPTLRFALFQPDVSVPLVRGDPGIELRDRFTAALEIVRAETSQVFSDRSVRYFGPMLGWQENPVAMVLQPAPVGEDSPAERLNSMLESLSMSRESVRKLSDLERRLGARRSVDLVLLPVGSADRNLEDIVLQIRKMPRGKALPIFVFGGRDSALAAQTYDQPLRRQTPTSEPTDLASVLRPVLEAAPLPPLATDERSVFAHEAVTLLAEIATDPKLSFYDLRSAGVERAIAGELTTGGSEFIALFSGLGTPQSQARLAELVALPSISVRNRELALTGFQRSVERFGNRLSRKQVAVQYDRYNQATEPEVTGALGELLDFLEARVQDERNEGIPVVRTASEQQTE